MLEPLTHGYVDAEESPRDTTADADWGMELSGAEGRSNFVAGHVKTRICSTIVARRWRLTDSDRCRVLPEVTQIYTPVIQRGARSEELL